MAELQISFVCKLCVMLIDLLMIQEMGIDGRSPRHSLGSNSSNLSSPPSPLVRAGESHGGAQHVLHHSNRVSTQSTHSSSAGGGGGGHPTYENH